jgi:hypothetical protein
MSARTLTAGRRSRPSLIVLAGRGLVVAAVLIILLLTFDMGEAALRLGQILPPSPGVLLAFLGAASIYMLGHGLRILRLALLVGGTRIGLRVIGAFHLMTSAANLIAPLKLGEVYRVVELGHVVGDPIRALILVWWERVFDVTTLLLLLVLAFAVTPDARDSTFLAIAAMSAVFVAATAAAALLLPGNLSRMSFFIIRRYRSPRSVPVLRMLAATRRAIDEAPRILRGKAASLSALSLLIWGCELAAFALMLPYLGESASVIEGFMAFLSSIIRGESALCEGVAQCAAAQKHLPYVVATHGALVISGLGASLYYARRRFRRAKPTQAPIGI